MRLLNTRLSLICAAAMLYALAPDAEVRRLPIRLRTTSTECWDSTAPPLSLTRWRYFLDAEGRTLHGCR